MAEQIAEKWDARFKELINSSIQGRERRLQLPYIYMQGKLGRKVGKQSSKQPTLPANSLAQLHPGSAASVLLRGIALVHL